MRPRHGGDAGHVVVDIRLAKQRRDGVLLRRRDQHGDLVPDTRKRVGSNGERPGSGHTRAQEADRRQAGSTQARGPVQFGQNV